MSDQFYPFEGQWLPDRDPLLVGPKNYITMQNLRYGPNMKPQGVNGFSKINSSVLVVRDGDIMIEIDPDLVDSDLTDFPFMVHLSSSCGTDSFDATDIFDTLGANKLKIRATDDNDNDLYVEIERWDHVSEVAILWIKVPTVSSTDTTYVFIEYSATMADNTTYVGDTDSTPAENVWDSNFKLVYHMHQAAGSLKDSTSNNNDVDSVGGTPAQTSGPVSKAIEFDGVNEYLQRNDNASLDISNNITVEVFFTLDDLTAGARLLAGKYDSDDPSWEVGFRKSTGKLFWNVMRDQGESITAFNSTPIAWTYFAGTYNGSVGKIWLDNAEDREWNDTGLIPTGTSNLKIGSYDFYTWYHDGKIAEVRISDTAVRGDAYKKATNHTLRDTLAAITMI